MENYYLYFLWIFLAVFSLYQCIQDAKNEKRFEDKSFPNYTLVYNRNVSCGKHKVGLFPAQTWTCADIRVDGMRLAYGLYPGLGVDDKCTETKGFDDVTELCLVMMDAIDIKKELWAALVTNATCDYIDESRLLLNLTLKEKEPNSVATSMANKAGLSTGKNDYDNHPSVLQVNQARKETTFKWDTMGPGYGWVHTIQCMAMRDKVVPERVLHAPHTEL